MTTYEVLRLGCVGVLACLSVACGGGSDGSGGGDEGADDSCHVAGAVNGGVQHQFGGSAFACSGSGTRTTVGQLLGMGQAVFEGGSINVTLEDLSPAPALGQTGPAAVKRVTVEVIAAAAADSNQPRESFTWAFPEGACGIDVQDTREDGDFDWIWFKAAVECSGEAPAVTPNTKAGVTLSQVTVNTFVSPL